MLLRWIESVLWLSLLVSLSPPAVAATINVPADQPTIQAGINAASNGDTVLVSAGIYYENITFSGKAITVASASGPAATVLNGSNTSNTSAVTFDSGETLKSVFSGFTVQNPSSVDINVYGASPTITGNILALSCNAISAFSDSAALIQGNLITGNVSTYCYGSDQAISTGEDSPVQIVGNIVSANDGPGVSVYQATGTVNVSQNTITQNQGPGLFIYSGGGPVTVIQNLITGNQGIGLSWEQPPITAISNTIANNAPSCCGSVGSEVYAPDVNSAVVFENNLIVATGSVPAFYCGYESGSPTLKNNDVFGANSASYGGVCQDPTGTDGNISADPLFVDILGENFNIQSGSPAIDAGTTSAPHEPGTDMDGDPRTTAGKIDIGADEYTASPVLTLSSLALHYSSQDVGTTSAPQVVTLTSNAKKAIAVNLIATGPNYSQTNNCGTSLAAGASCQISVSFSPLSGGTIDGVLGIFTNATTNPFAVDLVGTGLVPQVQFNASFYFYDQVIGTSRTQTATLTNVGQAPLAISSIVYSGTSDFTESNNCPATLAVESFCTVSITYTPTIIGSESGVLSLNDNAPPSPQTFNIYGSSVSAGVPTLKPTTLAFPTTLIGQSSAPQSATLTNTGKGPLGITNISSYNDFVETNNCPASLPVKASCTITVTYTPSVQGSEYGYVSIGTDGVTFYINLSMTGTGQAPVPAITSLSLASVPAGSNGAQVTITGSGFVYGSSLVWNGVPLDCCAYPNGSTQLTVNIPAVNLVTAGTYQLSIFTPTPGGGTSNSLPFSVYVPINYAQKSTPYNYRTITGTNLNLIDGSAQIASPFSIQFGGGNYTNLTVGEGGTVSFSNFAESFNGPMPTTDTQTLVAPFWAYLYAFGSPTGTDNNGFWEVQGTAPNRELIIEWRDVGYCCETTNTIKFQVVFFEGSGNILFNYANTIFGGQYANDNNGATATSGVQVTPAVASQFSYDKPLLLSQTSLLWYPTTSTATLSTNTLGFGYHQIGSTPLPQKVTLTNGGVAPLKISSITTDNPDFAVKSGCGTTLSSNQSCTIKVLFAPSAPYSETALLTVVDDATNSPQTVSLTGIGTITPIVVYPIMANFGSVTVGTTSTLPVVLANGSNSSLTIQQITATPSVYTETNDCGTSLLAGASCTVSVTFTPVQQGNVTGELSMGLNKQPTVNEVQLVGFGH